MTFNRLHYYINIFKDDKNYVEYIIDNIQIKKIPRNFILSASINININIYSIEHLSTLNSNKNYAKFIKSKMKKKDFLNGMM